MKKKSAELQMRIAKECCLLYDGEESAFWACGLPGHRDGIMLAGACILDAVPTGDEPVLDVCRRTYGRLFAKKKPLDLENILLLCGHCIAR